METQFSAVTIWPLDACGKSKGVQGDNKLTVKTMAMKKAELPEIRES
jgi:hypothetical protein